AASAGAGLAGLQSAAREDHRGRPGLAVAADVIFDNQHAEQQRERGPERSRRWAAKTGRAAVVVGARTRTRARKGAAVGGEQRQGARTEGGVRGGARGQAGQQGEG